MKRTKITLALVLVTVLLISPLASMDKGANVRITKKDGIEQQGELLVVKWNALVISVGESSAEETTSVPIDEINKVAVLKKSKTVGIGVAGTLIGAILGVGFGTQLAPEGTIRQGFAVAYSCLVGSAIGLIAGIIIGWPSVIDTFHFENLNKETRESQLLRLSDYAAIKGVR